MTIFKITPAASVFSGSTAFSGDSAGADTLSVLANAYLITDGADDAVRLAATGAWTVKVQGNIVSSGGVGLRLLAANSGVSLITVAADASIGGSAAAIDAASAANITNAGTLLATSTSAAGGAIVLRGAGSHSITNTGLIEGREGPLFPVIAIRDISTGGTFSLNNKAGGTINGTIGLGDRNATLTNSGTINGVLHTGAGQDTLTNYGAIIANSMTFGEGTNRLYNYGTIRESPDLHITFGNGADRLVNTGSITEEDGNGIGSGIALGNGNNVLNNSGTIGVGVVSGGSGVDEINNSGLLASWWEIQLGAGNDIVTNTMDMRINKIDMGSGSNRLTNSGTIYNYEASNIIVGGADADTIVNSGRIDVSVDLMGGLNKLTNSGTITGAIRLGASTEQGTSTLTNTSTGVIIGEIRVPGGVLVLVNEGQIEGYVGTNGPGSGSPGNDKVTNRGTIKGEVNLGYGTNTVINSGTIGVDEFTRAYGAFTSGTGANTFTNYEIISGTKVSGIVHGFITFSNGVDRFYGGDNAEKVYAGRGNDTIDLAGGDDVFLAEETFGGGVSTSTDNIDGGAGNDTYDAFNLPPGLTSNPVTGGAVINIDTVRHTVGSVLFVEPWASITSAANTAKGQSIGTDRISNFENVIATVGEDTVFGNPLANYIQGLDGRDILFGYEGNDTLDGGLETDCLIGGRGRDVLIGGPSGDLFILAAVQDSGTTAATRDLITDFQDNADIISLAVIDANAVNGSATNDSFAFIGNNVAFTPNTPGTVRTVWTATGYLIEGNTDNDIDAEFSIEVYDPSHSIVWDVSDFYL